MSDRNGERMVYTYIALISLQERPAGQHPKNMSVQLKGKIKNLEDGERQVLWMDKLEIKTVQNVVLKSIELPWIRHTNELHQNKHISFYILSKKIIVFQGDPMEQPVESMDVRMGQVSPSGYETAFTAFIWSVLLNYKRRDGENVAFFSVVE
ncbi:hypothetical protein Y1Q_0011649 [Alligator mississippiensis]|uniref:Uncharacterized protein n=1 Tax=Alligator mississippiensis TaxID=8496 RepID=A0A151M0L1_ALLMI|nr:hypothetical protein Y1Q_0011649 [Alligator mississippiensis]